jgi:hypothetical protein
VADDAVVLLVDAGQEAGHVDEREQRDVERVAGAHEAGGLLRRSMSRQPAITIGWLATMPTDAALDAAEAARRCCRPSAEDLEELAVVEHRLDDLAHVVGLVGRRRG